MGVHIYIWVYYRGRTVFGLDSLGLWVWFLLVAYPPYGMINIFFYFLMPQFPHSVLWAMINVPSIMKPLRSLSFLQWGKPPFWHQQWLSDGNLNSPVLWSLAGGPDEVGSCLEKQTAGDTKSGSEKPSLAARRKSQNFLDRRPKCLLLLLSELSSRSNSWTREGAYGGGSPQSGTLDTLRRRIWGQIYSALSSDPPLPGPGL